MEEIFPFMVVKDGVGQFVKASNVPKYRSECHYKASNPTEVFDLNNGHRDNLTSCCTLHVFLRLPNDLFDTYHLSDGKVFWSTIME